MEEDGNEIEGTWVRWGDIPMEVRRSLAFDPDGVLAANPPRWRNREKGYRQRELLVKESVAENWD